MNHANLPCIRKKQAKVPNFLTLARLDKNTSLRELLSPARYHGPLANSIEPIWEAQKRPPPLGIGGQIKLLYRLSQRQTALSISVKHSAARLEWDHRSAGRPLWDECAAEDAPLGLARALAATPTLS